MPKVSIIIVNFNTKDLVEDCVTSIIKSKPNSSYEIIVVDNSTNENEKFKSNNFKPQLKSKNIKLIENNKNLGFAKANNIGIKIAKGKFILLLNSDTLVRNEAIDKLLSFAEMTSDAGVIGARLLNKDNSVQGSVFRDPTLIRNIKQFWFGEKGLLDKYAPKSNEPLEVENLVMAAFLITPKALKKVGQPSEEYFMYFEDLDYCRRVRKAGLKVYYLPEAEVIHLHGESGKNIAEIKNQWRRLIPSSKIYHGTLKYYLIYFVSITGQKWQKLSKKN